MSRHLIICIEFGPPARAAPSSTSAPASPAQPSLAMTPPSNRPGEGSSSRVPSISQSPASTNGAREPDLEPGTVGGGPRQPGQGVVVMGPEVGEPPWRVAIYVGN
ncbi:unnamed protein product [Clonostachys solani]|uniref:Uncharacterized protein n=1 Tax=Clonostachys solani TaxID=160281 RepID=A0A9N9Z9H9_9HYPO|nr:unnamed protein product [Clonostachys solani]